MATGFTINLSKPTQPGKVVRIAIGGRTPDGKNVDPDTKYERNFGRNTAINLAADLLERADLPAEIVEEVRDQRSADGQDEEEDEVLPEVSPEEIWVVERMHGLWREAVERAGRAGRISDSTASTYRQHVGNFVAFVRGEFTPGAQGRRRQGP